MLLGGKKLNITRKRSAFLYLIVFGFMCGLGIFIYEYVLNANFWAMQPINRHLSEGAVGGKIIDRNGVILAETKDGKRVYAKDENIRKAMLHVVGDGSILIPTSVQSKYRSEMFGYNMITGFGAPKVLNTNKNITLTLNSEICGVVSREFKGQKGASVAYNYITGEIICMVSLPTYDLNDRPSITKDELGIYEGVYMNRALSSSFVPGSIFKVITAAAALNCMSDAESHNFLCEKVKTYDGERVTCMSNHGMIGLKNGLCKSCDIVFGDIAVTLNKEVMKKEVEKFGFNKTIIIDGIALAQSEYDVTNASEADLAWSGIGQYRDLVNPIHMMMIMGAFANGGMAIQPFMVKHVSSSSNIPIVTNTGHLYGRMSDLIISEKIKSMMRYTMKMQYGDSMFPGMKICAKTGTGEVGEDKKPHGWMIGFSEDKSFPFAFAVVVENSGFGIKTAGPIASVMMKEIKQRI